LSAGKQTVVPGAQGRHPPDPGSRAVDDRRHAGLRPAEGVAAGARRAVWQLLHARDQHIRPYRGPDNEHRPAGRRVLLGVPATVRQASDDRDPDDHHDDHHAAHDHQHRPRHTDHDHGRVARVGPAFRGDRHERHLRARIARGQDFFAGFVS
uniref:Uncharacterized protein n=1 Tax=Anopheles atroparvus TaxID=41427 RepID=A0A182JK08_ANOAO